MTYFHPRSAVIMAEVLEKTLAPGPEERFDLDANDESLPLLLRLLERHGDVCRVPAVSRAADGLVIHDPEDIRHVLLANRANYVKGVGMDRVRILLGNGLIVSDGEFWARQRRLMQPAFHGQAIRAFVPLMQRVNRALVERWAVLAARGETIDLTLELSEVALAVVLQALFGSDLDRLVASEGENPFDLLTRDTRRDLPFATRFRGLARFVRAIIAARRREGRVEADFLSMMMQAVDKSSGEPMAERALLDEVMTLIVAGHETTASTLGWTWYLLSQNEAVEERLHAAVGAMAADDPAAEPDPYVEQVLQESLRLYPPVWLFTRRALADDRLGGFHVPAGTDIFICPYLLHRQRAHWSDPEAFDPERFTAAAAARRHRFAYLPFSAGPRHCIGSGFAMAEMATHVALVAQRFSLRYAGPVPAEAEFQINLRPLALRMQPVPR